MPNTRLEALTTTPTPVARSSLLFIERDDAGNFISEKSTVDDILKITWEASTTTNKTLVNGQYQPVNCTAGSVNITLPITPTVGDTVTITDYSRTFGTNSCFVLRNGSKIAALAEDFEMDIHGVTVQFNYVDTTVGWRLIT